MEGQFDRSRLLLGMDVVERMQQVRVILFGVGGVGSWCAEALVRTGITHLTIVDFDRVAASNINRQLMATSRTVGQVKVEAMRQRLLDINPDAEITAIETTYTGEANADFHLGDYDYVIDCIDSLQSKIDLLLNATAEDRPKVFSSMGAALKLDPTRVSVAEFWKVKGCPLGAALRSRMRKAKLFPQKKITCVYSEELLKNQGESTERANGSLVHITGIYGMTLAGLVIKDINTN